MSNTMMMAPPATGGVGPVTKAPPCKPLHGRGFCSFLRLGGNAERTTGTGRRDALSFVCPGDASMWHAPRFPGRMLLSPRDRGPTGSRRSSHRLRSTVFRLVIPENMHAHANRSQQTGYLGEPRMFTVLFTEKLSHINTSIELSRGGYCGISKFAKYFIYF